MSHEEYAATTEIEDPDRREWYKKKRYIIPGLLVLALLLIVLFAPEPVESEAIDDLQARIDDLEGQNEALREEGEALTEERDEAVARAEGAEEEAGEALARAEEAEEAEPEEPDTTEVEEREEAVEEREAELDEREEALDELEAAVAGREEELDAREESLAEAAEEPEEEETTDAPEAGGFGNGVHVVGEDIEPGTYRTSGPAGAGDFALCYWERRSGLSGDFDDIIANGALDEGGTTVEIQSSDVAFESDGCQPWEPA